MASSDPRPYDHNDGPDTSLASMSSDGSAPSDPSRAPEPYEPGPSESSRARGVALLGTISVLVLVAVIILPSGLLQPGNSGMTIARFLNSLTSNVRDFFAAFASPREAGFFQSVISSYTAAFIAGAALGTCGAIYQGAFRNPLASPSTLGVVSGCLMGSIVYLLALYTNRFSDDVISIHEVAETLGNLSLPDYLWTIYGQPFCAVIGGCIVVAIALVVARLMGDGALNNIVLVVIGQVFSLVIVSICDTIRYYFEATGDVERGDLVQLAQAVPFNSFFTFSDLAPFALPLLVMLAILLATRSRMNILTFPDDEARSMGVDVTRLRTGIVMACTVITGLVVGFCGPITFVGFVCPHLARRVVGSDFRYLLPASFFAGALFLPVVLFLVNQLDIDAYQGLNLIATSVGCIVFLIIAYRNRGGAHAWR